MENKSWCRSSLCLSSSRYQTAAPVVETNRELPHFRISVTQSRRLLTQKTVRSDKRYGILVLGDPEENFDIQT